MHHQKGATVFSDGENTVYLYSAGPVKHWGKWCERSLIYFKVNAILQAENLPSALKGGSFHVLYLINRTVGGLIQPHFHRLRRVSKRLWVTKDHEGRSGSALETLQNIDSKSRSCLKVHWDWNNLQWHSGLEPRPIWTPACVSERAQHACPTTPVV